MTSQAERLAVETKTIQQRFSDRVRELSKSKNLSQEVSAFRAGIHRNHLGGTEGGKRNPSLKNIAISDATNSLFYAMSLFKQM